MDVIRYTDAKSFAADAMPMLMRAESQNNRISGRAMRFGEKGLPEDVLLIGVRDDGAVAKTQAAAPAGPSLAVSQSARRCVATAMMTPPHRLLLTEASPDKIDAIARWIRENQIAMPGFCGPTSAT